MSDAEQIVRIAAKGDGVTASGRHVAGAVTGDSVAMDGRVTPGPHHAVPPCRHFGLCGGCQLQHADDDALTQFVTERVVNAAGGQGIAAGEVLPAHLSPPCSRRRATLHGHVSPGGVILGFSERQSRRVINLRECHVLLPTLFQLVMPLKMLIARLGASGAFDVALTQTDQGVDCLVKGLSAATLDAREALLDFAREHQLARLSLDEGFGPETLWEPQPVTVTFAGVVVGLPPDSFLQATHDGEKRLLDDVGDFVGDARTIADLFSGIGMFAIAFSARARTLAVEASRDAHLACKSAAARVQAPVFAMHRDLYRNPLTAEELGRFDAVVLDPPRAGAREQIAQLAASEARRVVYVSCNPVSWARDAASLVAAGFTLDKLRPVGQFRWSTHVELTSLFTR